MFEEAKTFCVVKPRNFALILCHWKPDFLCSLDRTSIEQYETYGVCRSFVRVRGWRDQPCPSARVNGYRLDELSVVPHPSAKSVYGQSTRLSQAAFWVDDVISNSVEMRRYILFITISSVSTKWHVKAERRNVDPMPVVAPGWERI